MLEGPRAIDDETFRREVREQPQRLPQTRPQPLDAYWEPVELFQSVGMIVGQPIVRRRGDAMLLYRRSCELAFSRIEVSGSRDQSIAPEAKYRELFAISVAAPGIGVVRSRGLERTPHPQAVLETSRGAIFVVGIDSLLDTLSNAPQ